MQNKIIAGVLLIVLSPVLLITALLVRFLEPNSPIIFQQKRIGKHRKPFIIYKFRTLRSNPSNKLVLDVNDSRIALVGKILRKTHLDELPQLINILKGEMVFIGPRPVMRATDKKQRLQFSSYHERDLVHPGLTGLRQLYKREQARRHFVLDLILIKHMHQRQFQIWILARTIMSVLGMKGV